MNIFFLKATAACKFCNPLASNSFQELLDKVLSSVIYIVFPFLILMMVYTGFLFLKAQGVPAELEKARSSLVWTIVGGAIILGSYVIKEILVATMANISF